MSTLTIAIDPHLKFAVQKNLKKEGTTLTFLIHQAIKAYLKGKIHFEMVQEDLKYTQLSRRLSKLLEKVDVSTLPSLEEQLSDV